MAYTTESPTGKDAVTRAGGTSWEPPSRCTLDPLTATCKFAMRRGRRGDEPECGLLAVDGTPLASRSLSTYGDIPSSTGDYTDAVCEGCEVLPKDKVIVHNLQSPTVYGAHGHAWLDRGKRRRANFTAHSQ